MLNVSRDATNKATKILKDGDEQLVQAVTDGTVSLDAASAVVDFPKRQQRELVKKGGVKAAAKKLRAVKKAAKSKAVPTEPTSEPEGTPEPILEPDVQVEPASVEEFPLLAEAHAAVDALVATARRTGRITGLTLALGKIIAACAKLEAKFVASNDASVTGEVNASVT